MLDKLHIKNFQCIKTQEIDLEQITTIVGQSDVGKSAIIRALRLLVLNVPAGNAFIRDGSDCVSVKLDFDNNGSVTRIKSKKDNIYKLGQMEFRAFGRMPEPVENVLNLDELNFQDQHDSPFWLSLSAGEVSKQLNSVIDLDIIDSALSFIGKETRVASMAVSVAAGRVEQAIEIVDGLVWVQNASKELNRVEEIESKLVEVSVRAKVLGGFVDRISSLETEVIAGDEMRGQLVGLVEMGGKAIDLEKKVNRLTNQIVELNRVEWIIKQGRVEFDLAVKWQAVVSVGERISKLKVGLVKHRLIQSVIVSHKRKLEDTEAEIHDRFDVCPLCGQKRDHDV